MYYTARIAIKLVVRPRTPMATADRSALRIGANPVRLADPREQLRERDTEAVGDSDDGAQFYVVDASFNA